MSGLTAAVISWDHELDELLNSHIVKSDTPTQRIPVLDLVKRAQDQEPRAYVSYVELNPAEGAVAFDAGVAGRRVSRRAEGWRTV